MSAGHSLPHQETLNSIDIWLIIDVSKSQMQAEYSYGCGMPRSLQIFDASLLGISVWRGTVEVLRLSGLK